MHAITDVTRQVSVWVSIKFIVLIININANKKLNRSQRNCALLHVS